MTTQATAPKTTVKRIKHSAELLARFAGPAEDAVQETYRSEARAYNPRGTVSRLSRACARAAIWMSRMDIPVAGHGAKFTYDAHTGWLMFTSKPFVDQRISFVVGINLATMSWHVWTTSSSARATDVVRHGKLRPWTETSFRASVDQFVAASDEVWQSYEPLPVAERRWGSV